MSNQWQEQARAFWAGEYGKLKGKTVRGICVTEDCLGDDIYGLMFGDGTIAWIGSRGQWSWVSEDRGEPTNHRGEPTS